MSLTQKSLIVVFIVLAFAIIPVFSQGEYKQGVQLYEQREYGQAVVVLKKASKKSKRDSKIWNLLGLVYLKKRQIKLGRKAFAKAVKYEPRNSSYNSNFAYALMRSGRLNKAEKLFTRALELNPKAAENYYHRGTLFIRKYRFRKAISDAEKAITIRKTYAQPYFLKAKALLYEFSVGWVKANDTPLSNEYLRKNLHLLQESIAVLKKCRIECLNGTSNNKITEKLDSFEVFYDTYKELANLGGAAMHKLNGNSQDGFKILSKPRPGFTDTARTKGIQGWVVLLVEFSSKGRIQDIFIIRRLGGGLDENSVRAARKMKFVPAKKNGRSISVFRIIPYGFTIY